MENDNEKVSLIYDHDYLVHTQRQHPESKERLEHIIGVLEKENIMNRLEMIAPKPAEFNDLALVHDPSYIRSIEEACKAGKRFLDMDTYIVPESYRVALLSAGGVVTGLREIMNGAKNKIFALNRPPGHHAERSRAMGFCLFNNIAIAAAVAKRDYGLKRIAIVDWDVHHGNGTQHAFEEDREVLFISSHQSPAYPGSGQLMETGRNSGEGFTVNIPLPPGCGDAEYALVYDKIVIPILDRFKPELLLISAGFDAYRLDHLAGMSMTQSGYYYLAETLNATSERWSKGRVLLCLEGGYHLQGQAGAVVQTLNALGGWGLPLSERAPDQEPGIHFKNRLQEALNVQRQFWDI